MRFFSAKSRVLFSALLLAGFFFPAYKGISAFRFIPLAINEIETKGEVTAADVTIVLIPVLLIPAISIYVLINSILKRPTNRMLVRMPLLLIVAFFAILIMVSMASSNKILSLSSIGNLQVGFYICSISAALLFATKNFYTRRHKGRPSYQKNTQQPQSV